MANLKELMGMEPSVLQELGLRSGLTFPPGMRKSAMASQLANAAATGWMEQNQELMSGSLDEGYEDVVGSYGTSAMLSDAARAAQMIHGAGYGNTFHEAMGSGGSQHLGVIETYLHQLGATPEDVWMHLPKMNQDEPTRHFKSLQAYMRDTLVGHQDIMRALPDHHAGDIMAPYQTKESGNVGEAFNSLASLYLDTNKYTSQMAYQDDLDGVSRILEKTMGHGFKEVAYIAATGGKAGYMQTLPQIGDPSIAEHVRHPAVGYAKDGFPMDAEIPRFGEPRYSLTASLTHMPEVKGPASESAYNQIKTIVSGLAGRYNGETDKVTGRRREGYMDVYKDKFSDRDLILDSASRYSDAFDVQSGYNNLDPDERTGNIAYNRENIQSVINNNFDVMEAGQKSTFDPAPAATNRVAPSNSSQDFVMLPGSGFQADFGSPTSRQSRQRAQQPEFNGDLDRDPVTYHRNIKQGSDEWLRMREGYDITGSQVGTLLGNGSYTTMQKKIAEMEGLYPTSRDTNSEFAQQMFARGHASEASARPRVESQFGINIEEVGAITNSNYPNMMYSPDGLIGDDALWEHKNPNVTKKFANLKAGEHQDYMDQIQLGMHLSGRSKTLFSQTVGNNTQSEWIDADPEWYDKNKDQLDSIAGRREAVRNYTTGNQKFYEDALAGAEDDRQRNLITRRYRLGAQRAAKGEASEFIHDDDVQTPGTGLSISGSGGLSNPMAGAVKEGILAAQEENKSKGNTGSGDNRADADFDDLGSPRGWNASSLRRDLADEGGGGSGGGGGGRKPPSPFDAITGGIAGGSMASAGSGVANALSMTPWGRAAVIAYGGVQIASEMADKVNDSLGAAQDAGMSNPVAYAAQMQGMEMMGLSERQAANVTNTTHNAYGSLLNGDPSAAARIVRETRGLVTIGEILSTQGDSVALSALISERGHARGWGQARISAAMSSAGLEGMGRTYERSAAQDEADGVRDRGNWTSTRDAVNSAETLQSGRMAASPAYLAQRKTFENGDGIMDGAAGVVNGVRRLTGDSSLDFIRDKESGNRDFTPDGEVMTSPSGARGRYQILPSTAAKPGYGLTPSDGSLEDDARLAEQYYQKLVQVNGGDERKAMAAYTDGQGRLETAMGKYGSDWLNHMPKQAQDRVRAWDDHVSRSKQSQQGADGFTRNGQSYGQAVPPVTIKVDIKAQVNNQSTSATVTSTNGQTVTQQINTNTAGTQQRR